jgi:hypothetical protein
MGNVPAYDCRSSYAKKGLEGREEDIRHCVACNLCLARLFRDAPMTCYINPVCAHESDPKYSNPPPAECLDLQCHGEKCTQVLLLTFIRKYEVEKM